MACWTSPLLIFANLISSRSSTTVIFLQEQSCAFITNILTTIKCLHILNLPVSVLLIFPSLISQNIFKFKFFYMHEIGKYKKNLRSFTDFWKHHRKYTLTAF